MQTEAIKPCLALMGEFSSGKTTLANLLIGESPLPVRIIATQLPPVKISFGTGDPFKVNIDGTRVPFTWDEIDRVDIAATRYLQLFSTEDFLVHCDLLDMPGISDPNMSSDVWERMIDEADGVIWCSHAVQAWRQSEAAVWADLPSYLHDRSLLLLTQIDKVNSPTDRARIIQRVSRETEGLFKAVLPISLLVAMQEQEDYNKWAQSGAEAFVKSLIDLLNDMKTGQENASVQIVSALKSPKTPVLDALDEGPQIQPRRIRAARNGRV